jgi:hypothetical protein
MAPADQPPGRTGDQLVPPKPHRSLPHPGQWEEMFTPKGFAKVLKVRASWLAKARKRGDGPPFYRAGRSIRYFPLRKPE